MTVTYSAKAATATFSCFFKLLMKWRGSIYKILWKEFMIFAFCYFALSFLYRFILIDKPVYKSYFEMTAEYCAQYGGLIPVVFVLGFYVNFVASRWWEKFKTIPWPGSCAMLVTVNLHGHDEKARLMRRTVMRYVCLSFVMTMASISPPVKKRFPTWQHMVDAGFMLSNEQKILENIESQYNKYFIPLVWAAALVNRARKEGRIKDDFAVKSLIDEINSFRVKLFTLFNFDWVTIPLVYTQVVTLAVYTFFLSCLMGRQFLDNGHRGDLYFPFFTFLQFLFYMGWLKVAETMLNPFGEDDDDFDINHIIDRNLKLAYLIVDEMHAEHPELIKDQYWDSKQFELPYTTASEPFKTDPLIGSAANIDIPQSQRQFISGTPSVLSFNNNDGIDMHDENFPFVTGTSARRASVLARQQSSGMPRNASKTSVRLGEFLKSMKRNASSRKMSNTDLEAELQRAKERSNAKSIKHPLNNEKVSNDVQSDLECHQEIFHMSESDSDDVNEQVDSTVGLVSDANDETRWDNRGVKRRRSIGAGAPDSIPGVFKAPVRRTISVEDPLSPPITTVDQHHHQPSTAKPSRPLKIVINKEGAISGVDKTTVKQNHLDTITEDLYSPCSPVEPCHFTIGSSSTLIGIEENPLDTMIKEQRVD